MKKIIVVNSKDKKVKVKNGMGYEVPITTGTSIVGKDKKNLDKKDILRKGDTARVTLQGPDRGKTSKVVKVDGDYYKLAMDDPDEDWWPYWVLEKVHNKKNSLPTDVKSKIHDYVMWVLAERPDYKLGQFVADIKKTIAPKADEREVLDLLRQLTRSQNDSVEKNAGKNELKIGDKVKTKKDGRVGKVIADNFHNYHLKIEWEDRGAAEWVDPKDLMKNSSGCVKNTVDWYHLTDWVKFQLDEAKLPINRVADMMAKDRDSSWGPNKCLEFVKKVAQESKSGVKNDLVSAGIKVGDTVECRYKGEKTTAKVTGLGIGFVSVKTKDGHEMTLDGDQVKKLNDSGVKKNNSPAIIVASRKKDGGRWSTTDIYPQLTEDRKAKLGNPEKMSKVIIVPGKPGTLMNDKPAKAEVLKKVQEWTKAGVREAEIRSRLRSDVFQMSNPEIDRLLASIKGKTNTDFVKEKGTYEKKGAQEGEKQNKVPDLSEAKAYVKDLVTKQKLSRSETFEIEREVRHKFSLTPQQAHDVVYQAWPEKNVREDEKQNDVHFTQEIRKTQQALSEWLKVLGLTAMASEVKSEDNPETLKRYAQVVMKELEKHPLGPKYAPKVRELMSTLKLLNSKKQNETKAQGDAIIGIIRRLGKHGASDREIIEEICDEVGCSKQEGKQLLKKYEDVIDQYFRNDEKMMNPGHVDEAKWQKAKKISMKTYGEHRWPFVTDMYEKLGGKF